MSPENAPLSRETPQLIKYKCPKCGKKLSAPRGAAGKPAQCPSPKCKFQHTVPPDGTW